MYSLLQKYADWREERLSRVHNSAKQEAPFAWGLAELGLDSAADDPARALSEYVQKHLANSDDFYALPERSDYSLNGSRLTFPSSIEVDSPPSRTVHARVYPGTRGDYGVIVIPHWNA